MCNDSQTNIKLLDDKTKINLSSNKSNNELVVDLFPLPDEEKPGDNTIIALPGLILETLISDEDYHEIDGWYNIFPELALTRNPELTEKYGLEVVGSQGNKAQHFPRVDFALGGVQFKANPVVRMATYEKLSHADIPDFAAQLNSALCTIQETPKEELSKIDCIEVDMEMYIVPGKLKVKKLKLK